MLELLGWALRTGAAVLLIAAGAALHAAAPEQSDLGTPASLARIECETEWSRRFLDALRVNPDAALRRQAEFQNRCPAPPRETWDTTTRDRGLMLLAGAFTALLAGLLIASAVRRERIAAETLAALRQRRHD